MIWRAGDMVMWWDMRPCGSLVDPRVSDYHVDREENVASTAIDECEQTLIIRTRPTRFKGRMHLAGRRSNTFQTHTFNI